MQTQPLLDQRRDLERQAQQHVARAGRAGFGGGLEDALQLVVVHRRDHGRGQHGGGNAGGGERADRGEAAVRRRRPRLQGAGQFGVERGDGERDANQVAGGHPREDVEVAQHPRALCHDQHGVAEALQHVERPPGDPQRALRGLPRVGVGPEHDRPRHVAGPRQLRLQPLRQVGFEQQPGLKIEAGREADIGVGGPGVAVDAAVLAAPVRVERAVEAQVWAFVEGERRAAFLADQLRRGPRRLLAPIAVQRAPAIVERLRRARLVAQGGVRRGAAPLAGARPRRGGAGEGLGHGSDVAQPAANVQNKIRTVGGPA